MIRPAKHSHPDRTAIYLGYLLIKQLKARRAITYGDLLNSARQRAADAEVLLPAALCTLYSLGLIEYRSKSDSFEYVGPG